MHFKCERQPFGWVLAHKLSHTTKTAHHLDARFLKYGDPKRYFRTFGEKEHTSKRVSIIASDNVTSKAKCATWGQQGVLGIVQIEDKQQSDAKCLQSYTRCITQENASVFRPSTVRLGSSPMLFPDT